MSTLDLAAQVQQLDKRLAEVEATLLRLERLLISLQTAPADEQIHITPLMARRVRFVSPRLRRRAQMTDFVMVVTREPSNASL